MAGRQENPRKRDREEEEEKEEVAEDFPAAAAGDGNLRVKLRIRPESPEKKDHVCGECNKRFSSGKALGGHMSSAHVQANRDYSYRRKQLRGGKGSGDEDEEDGGREYYRGKDGKIRCFLCGKSFPSTKSLFGHMRCHPDRYWRGMEPPTNIFDNNKVSEEPEEEERVDLLGHLSSWASTAKRGRSPIKRTSSSSSSDADDKELHEAVHHLVSLCNGDLHLPQNPNLEIEKKDENEDSNSERDNNSKNIDESPNSSISAKKKKTKDASLMPDLHNNDNNSVEKFKCSTCNKCFSSHQALGGHRSSHNKFKISIHNAIDDCINAVSGDENNQSNNNGANATASTSGAIHECSVCGKIFATGRALGGHKRCHSILQSTQQPDAANSPEGSSTNDGDGDDNEPKILDFDLNEFPDMDGSS